MAHNADEFAHVESVGTTFLHQYYNLLLTQPEQLVQLYGSDSVFSRGEASRELEEKKHNGTLVGMDVIGERLRAFSQELKNHDFKIRVCHVDTQPSTGSGALVIVSGYVLTEAGANAGARRFYHTLVLVPVMDSRTQYYIKNDCWRMYPVEDITVIQQQAPAAAAATPSASQTYVTDSAAATSVSATTASTTTATAAEEAPAPTPAAPEKPPTRSPKQQPQQPKGKASKTAPAEKPATPAATTATPPSKPAQPPKETTVSAAAIIDAHTQEQQSEEAAAAAAAAAAVPEPPKETSAAAKPAAAAPAAEAAPAIPSKMSWAERAKMKPSGAPSGGAGYTVAAAIRPATPPPAAPAAAAAPEPAKPVATTSYILKGVPATSSDDSIRAALAAKVSTSLHVVNIRNLAAQKQIAFVDVDAANDVLGGQEKIWFDMEDKRVAVQLATGKPESGPSGAPAKKVTGKGKK